MKKDQVYVYRPGTNEGQKINSIKLQAMTNGISPEVKDLFKVPKPVAVHIHKDKEEQGEEFQRVSKKNDPRWAQFTKYFATKDFVKDRLGIKAFRKMNHSQNIMALLENEGMKKRIVKFLSN